jgi:DNA mismatch repair protein MutS
VGRGTSTFDGISIAWAVAEFLHETEGRRARTLFATHYHELTELALLFARIKNIHVRVKEWNDQVIFVRKVAEGSCDHSYGIQVARLAGVPKAVIVRAREILSNLETMELTPDHKPVLARHGAGSSEPASAPQQTDLFDNAARRVAERRTADILRRLRELDIDTLKPLEALTMLAELQREANTDEKHTR